MQYTYMVPQAGQAYLNAPSGAEPAQQAVFQDFQQAYMEGTEAQQVVLQEGQQVMLQDGQVVQQGMQLAYAAPEAGGAEAQQATVVGAAMVAASPARVNVSPELFAKLAAGGQLTPDEMAQLSGGQPAPGEVEAGQPALVQQPMPGQPTPEQQQQQQQQLASPIKQPTPGATESAGMAPGSAKASDKNEKKDKKDKTGSKKSLKASKKKNKSCC